MPSEFIHLLLCVLLLYIAVARTGKSRVGVIYEIDSVSLERTLPPTIIIYKIEYPEYDTSQFILI